MDPLLAQANLWQNYGDHVRRDNPSLIGQNPLLHLVSIWHAHQESVAGSSFTDWHPCKNFVFGVKKPRSLSPLPARTLALQSSISRSQALNHTTH